MVEEISSWADLLRYCERHRDVRTHEGDRLRLTYDLDGAPVPVGMHVSRAATGTSWLACNMKIAPTDTLRARSALVANTELPIGGLCIVADHAVLRQSLPLRGLRAAHLDHTLRALALLRGQLMDIAARSGEDLDTPYAYLFR